MKESRTHPAIEAIQTYLDQQGISQSELARRLGWGRMVVQRRLSGDADLTVVELEEIARVLDVPVTRFLPADEQAAAS